jgi:hypothetical protein
MRNAAPSVVSYTNGVIAGTYQPNAVLCDLFTLTPVFGSAITITSLDQNISWRGALFSAGGIISTQNTPFAQRQNWRCSNRLDVDTLELMLAATPSMMLNGSPFLAAVRRGDMDQAWVLAERFMMAPCTVTLNSNGNGVTLASGPPFAVEEWPVASGTHPIVGSTAIVDGRLVTITAFADSTHCTISPGGRSGATVNAIFPIGTVTIFAGYWFDTTINRVTCKVTVKSGLIKLDNVVPQKIIGPSCSHTLFDAGCGLIEANYHYTGAVQSGSTAFVVNTNLTPPAVIAAPTNTPTFSFNTSGVNVNIPEATYFIRQTYMYALGETPSGPQAEAIASGHPNWVLTVNSPPSASGALGWNLYVAVDTGALMRQNTSPIPIGTAFVEGQTGMTTGVFAPVTNSPGFYAMGYIQFTSGTLSGRRFPIAGNTGSALTMEIPLPVVPGTGDTFYAVPGCDLATTTCDNKFASPASGSPPAGGSNLIHFGGYPWVPTPEKAFVGT